MKHLSSALVLPDAEEAASLTWQRGLLSPPRMVSNSHGMFALMQEGLLQGP
jgi:hypothetical protein